MKKVFIFNNAAIKNALSIARDKLTPSSLFREMVKIVTLVMAGEALKNLRLKTKEIETPMGPAKVKVFAKAPIIVVILRAANGMLEPMLQLTPDSSVGYIGLRRIEGVKKNKGKGREKVQLEHYYYNVPEPTKGREVIVLDPMLASGSSGSFAVDLLKRQGHKKIKFMCLVTCTVGINRMTKDHPNVMLYTAAKDRKLLKNNYIAQDGLGDAGDRMNNT